MIRSKLARVLRYLRDEQRPLRDRPFAAIDTDLPVPADAVRWMGEADVNGERYDALFCHPRSSAVFRWHARRGERVTAFCTLLPEVWDKNTGGVEFRLVARAGGRETVAAVTLHPGTRTADRRWHRLSVPLPEGDIEIAFETRTPAGAPGDFAWAAWGNPAIARTRPARDTVRMVGEAVRRRGITGAPRALAAAAAVDGRIALYRQWAQRHAPTPQALAAMRSESERFAYRPLISLITPVYNTDPIFLEACIASVLAQVYPRWELCLCNDGSTSEATVDVLRRQTDPRIKVVHLERNGGISAASNGALAAASGDFIALLDSDDELTPDALVEMVRYLNAAPDTDVVYSDEDKRDEDGGVSEPYFKPCWSPEHLLSAMYICHFTMARRDLVQRLGGFRSRCDGSQDHDLLLRLSEATPRIAHLPKILYHWRRSPQSTAASGSARPWANDTGRRAVADFLERNGLAGDVVSGGVHGLYRVRFEIVGTPTVSVIVAGAAAAASVEAIRAATAYAAFEVVPIEGEGAALTVRLNAAVRQSGSDHVVIVDAALRPLDDTWLHEMLAFSQQAAIGAVGARLEYADGRLRHIGVVTCTERGPAAIFDGAPGTSYGYFSSAIGVRNYAAVSGECLMTRRAVFDEAGGFDASLPWRGADVDYCVRVRRAGRRVVFTPYARLQWTGAPGPARIDLPPVDDPYYNPNLSRASGDYALGE